MAEPDLIPDTEDEDEFIRLHSVWSTLPNGTDIPKTGYWGSHMEKGGKYTVKLPRGCDPDKEGGGEAAKRLPGAGAFDTAKEANEARARYLFKHRVVLRSVRASRGKRGVRSSVPAASHQRPSTAPDGRAVSYTHLTLPTICSV